MSSNTFSSAPLSARHHFNLRMILRDANERYQFIADAFRQSLHLSHHARKRAYAKGLKIDTTKAARCPQKLVSVLPLHVIDTTASPTLNRAASEDLLPVIPAPAPVVAQRPVVPRITIPILSPTRKQIPVVSAELSVSRTKLEPGQIYAPAVLRGQGNPWRGPTSRFSITPNDELFQVHVWDSPKPVIPDLSQGVTEIEDDVSSGSSEASSSIPSTPDEFSSLVVRFKRKSLDVEEKFEKRPKYIRKEWNRSGSSPRRNVPEKSLQSQRVPVYSDISHLLM
ncbi:hypothetical protein GYMLUDRAFT_93827 [Collybiopsis luxurians FD-317 M1]|nr:hypothetical protein GYMLUDRAFT_93827 [Collybiopsis luxurians FD-317 M1]